MGKKKTEEPTNKAPAPSKEDDDEDTPAIKELKALDDKYCALQNELDLEIEKLRKKFADENDKKFADERLKILNDATLKDASETAEADKATPGCKGFWLQALQNCEELSECLEDYDEPVLEYLEDIRKSYLDATEPRNGKKLEYFFKENPYFSNKVLSQEVHYKFDPEKDRPWKQDYPTEIKGSKIEWKDGKDVTVEVTTKKVKGGGAKKAKQKGKQTVEPRPSFFRVAFANQKKDEPLNKELRFLVGAEDAEDEDELVDAAEQMMEQMADLNEVIAEGVVAYAVRYYTGEACEGLDDDDEDSESEDMDEDDEETDEESDEPKPKAKSKGGKKQGGGKPAGGGEKQEECKQQ